jgi:tetratricopeptide (TPR) repeat protein
MYANSETLWRWTVSKNPDCWMALNNLGIVLLEKGRPEEAASYSRAALRSRPEYAEADVTLGNALLAQHRPDDAIPLYKRALSLRFDEREIGRAKASYNLGNAYLQEDRPADAINYYNEALQTPSGLEADVNSNLATALLREGQGNDAISHYEKVIEIRSHGSKQERARAEYNLANALIQIGRLDEGINDLKIAVRLAPNYSEAHNNLGRVLISQNDFQEGISQYEQALRIVPDSSLFANNLAWQLATCPDPRLRDGERAVTLARQANQASNGKDPMILNTLAAAYAENGQFQLAIGTGQDALRLAQLAGNSDLSAFLQQEITLYRNNSPFHQTRR